MPKSIDARDLEQQGLAVIRDEFGLELLVHRDEIWEETRGTLGRVNVGSTVQWLAQQIERMDKTKRMQLAQRVSQDRGFHSGRLELDVEYGHSTPEQFATKILAHRFDISEEVLLVAGQADIFQLIPPAQAGGLKIRLKDRFMEVVSDDIDPGDTIHLLSDGKLVKVVG